MFYVDRLFEPGKQTTWIHFLWHPSMFPLILQVDNSFVADLPVLENDERGVDLRKVCDLDVEGDSFEVVEYAEILVARYHRQQPARHSRGKRALAAQNILDVLLWGPDDLDLGLWVGALLQLVVV